MTSETQTSPVGSPRSGRRGHHHHHHRHHHTSSGGGRGEEEGSGQRGRRGSQGSGSWYNRTTHSQVRHKFIQGLSQNSFSQQVYPLSKALVILNVVYISV